MVGVKSKVLVIGGTGYIGKLIVRESAKAGHPTFALVRESSLFDPVKAKLVQSFRDQGVRILFGDLKDHENLVKAIKQVDVVISALGGHQILDQTKIIPAIKEAGNVKRFLPAEFADDVDRMKAVEPLLTEFTMKAQIRRAVEAEGIPYTYVINNCFAGYFLAPLAQVDPSTFLTSPPRDKVTIYGDGTAKAIFNKEEDIAAYTVKTIDDPRTLNKTLYINPPKNIFSLNELVALWEKKIGKTLEKTYLSKEQMLKSIQETPMPINIMLALNLAIFVEAEQTWFSIDPSFGFEASELYPDVQYTSVDEYLNQFV